MPIYEYKCKKCGKVIDVFEKEPKDKECECGGIMKRIPSIFNTEKSKVQE